MTQKKKIGTFPHSKFLVTAYYNFPTQQLLGVEGFNLISKSIPHDFYVLDVKKHLEKPKTLAYLQISVF